MTDTNITTTNTSVVQVIGQSEKIGELVVALCRAQGEMISPRRNKKVFVKSDKGNYEFRYTTLDTMIDMTRPILAENGLAVINVVNIRTRTLHTRLIHISEQWMETEGPIDAGKPGPQAWASAVSYARRINFATLLNIASDEDDDGNIAEGNGMQVHQGRGPATVLRATPPVALSGPETRQIASDTNQLRTRFERLIGLCDEVMEADDVSQNLGIRLLQAWQIELDAFSAFRAIPARAAAWNLIRTRVPEAIRKIWGEVIATAWLASLQADTPAALAAIREAWKGEWRDAIRDLKQRSPIAHGLFLEHCAAQGKRCDQAEQDQTEAAEAPAEAANSLATNSLAATEPPPAEPQDGSVDDGPGDFCEVLLNPFGEPTSLTPFRTPASFAEAFAERWHAADGERARRALEEHNADALALCSEIDQAAADLLGGLATPEPPPRVDLMVTIPLNDKGNVEIAVYLTLLAQALSAAPAGDIDAWQDANRPNIEKLAPMSRAKAQKLVAARRAELGLPPAA